uniref:Shikimate dehydrogenase (NADP(+)) n=1 Tax=Kingella kingae TaxID=504 RepID=A0A1W1WVD5_KINKI|nr:aroE [Kingella kingae]
MTPRYTVFGNPVAHSKSPQIHQCFAAQEGAQIEYTRTFAENTAQDFGDGVRAFFAQNGRGANVTLPFKGFAHDLVQAHTERARAAGAVNTLIPQADGTLLGDNTDGEGLVRDLCQHLQFNLHNKNILLLGAGGATRGVVLPLAACNPASITIANRTHDKAIELAQLFDIAALPFHQLNQSYDIIINATSGSIDDSIPDVSPNIFAGCSLAYDMFYANQPTAFMQFAAQHGAQQTSDGLGMLVGQAAASYQQWRQFTPEIAPVIAQIRAEMTA